MFAIILAVAAFFILKALVAKPIAAHNVQAMRSRRIDPQMVAFGKDFYDSSTTSEKRRLRRDAESMGINVASTKERTIWFNELGFVMNPAHT